MSHETFKSEIIPQLDIVGLIVQETDPDDKRRLLIYPTMSTPIISAKLAEEGKSINPKNYERNWGEDSEVTTPNTQGCVSEGGKEKERKNDDNRRRTRAAART